jgi:hypothetical protein
MAWGASVGMGKPDIVLFLELATGIRISRPLRAVDNEVTAVDCRGSRQHCIGLVPCQTSQYSVNPETASSIPSNQWMLFIYSIDQQVNASLLAGPVTRHIIKRK